MRVTLIQILNELRDYVNTNHSLLSFGFGEINEINPKNNKEINYPLVWIVPGNSRINGNQMLLSFNMLVIDLGKQDKSNLETIMSKALLLGNDIIKNFWQTAEIGEEYDLWSINNNAVSFEPIFFEFSHDLNGWKFTFDIEIQNNSNCIN